MLRHTSQKTIITAGVIAIVAAVALIIALRDAAPNFSGSPENNESGRYASSKNFTHLVPSEWNYHRAALKDIQTLTPNQEITLGVVYDPTQEEIAYFATVAGDPEKGEDAVLGIYRYDTSDYTFERIYRKVLPPEDFPGIAGYEYRVWHVVGYDQGKLVVLTQYPSYAPEVCDDILTRGRKKEDNATQMLSLDLSDPFAKGLVPYSIPDDEYKAALDREKDCNGRL